MALLTINPINPEARKIQQVTDSLKRDGVIIIPTDTVYSLACSIHNRKAIERICKIKNVKVEKSLFTFICRDLSQAAIYAKQIDNSIFKLMKKSFPGPFTFILEASHEVPKVLQYKRKTIGLRIPDHEILLDLIDKMDSPLIVTSLPEKELEVEYSTDPTLMYDEYGNQVDFVIDGGIGDIEETTVLDCTGDELEIVRQGIGEI